MKVLKPFQVEDGTTISKRRSALVAHQPRVGKQMPVDTIIMTPQGERLIGNLVAGDFVIGVNGSPTQVKAVYPQGVQPSYRVSFRDGSFVECGLDHLWTVQDANDRKLGVWRTKSLRQILIMGLTYKDGKAKRYVPQHGPVQFTERQHKLPPYLIGVLIGDGSLLEAPLLTIADRDRDILDRIRPWCERWRIYLRERRTGPNCVQIRLIPDRPGKVNRIQRIIRTLGLNVYSPDKFIPNEYRFDSIENRIELLRGLMDTDGHCAHRNVGASTSFSSHSKRLVDDVLWLVRSLGGTGTAHAFDRGEKDTEYRAVIQVDFCPFHTAFKKQRWAPVTTSDCKIVRNILSAEYVRTVEQICIEVDASDGLYLTKDFIPTHNTGVAIHASDVVGAKLIVVVCPASVIENWRRAIDDFRTGGWTAFIVSYNKLADFLPRLRAALKERDLLLDVVVVDESHYAKNRESARTRHIYGSTCDGAGGLVELAERVYCLTGTPMPNDPTELWPMLRAIAPGLIHGSNGKPMTLTQFKMRYCRMVQTGFGMKIVGSKNYADLKQRMRGFVLRRTRKEVFGRDLPAPQKVFVKPSREFKAELQALQDSEQGRKVIRALEAGGLKALIREEKNAAGLRRMFGLAKVPPIISLIAEELDMEPGKKQVLFCFHTAVIDALANGLRKYGVLVYDGRTSPERKVRIQDSFRDNPKHRIVIGQIAAMGLGLDFSASSDCMLVEQDWVGSANEQAAARIFNMGKDEPTFVRWAILSGSFDEQIVAACDRKLTASMKILGS